MAARGVKISIGAQDKASSVLERVNQRISALQRPARQTFGALQRFSRVTGLSSIRNGFFHIARVGREAFHAMGSIVPVLGTLTGAATLGGLYKLTAGWANLGSHIQTAAHSMGLAPQRLMKMRSAAALAGGSAESMSAALDDLSKTQWRASNGFDPAALATFQSLGVSVKDLKTLKPDVLFEKVAGKLRAIRNPAAQAVAATKVFGGAAAGILPVLQQSEAAYKANLRQAEKYGVINARGAEAATEMQRSLTGLSLAASGLGYRIAEDVAPYIKTIIDGMSSWIATNKDWIATNIGRAVRTVGDALQRFVGWLHDGGWDRIVQKAQRFAEILGGWRGVAMAAAGAMSVLWAAPVIGGFATLLLSIVQVTKALKAMRGAGDITQVAEMGAAASFGNSPQHIPKGRGFARPLKAALPTLGSFAYKRFFQAYLLEKARERVFGDKEVIAALRERPEFKAASPEKQKEFLSKLNLKDAIIDDVKTIANAVGNKMPLWGAGLGGSYFEDHRLRQVQEKTNHELGTSTEQFNTFANAVAGIEGARYNQMGGANKAYAGKYQMGAGAIKDAAASLHEPTPSRKEFLNNPEMQEKYFRAFTMRNFSYLNQKNEAFRHMAPSQKLAVLGYAHNQGAGGAQKWLETGEVRKDAFGTSGSLYAERVALALQSRKEEAPDRQRDGNGAAATRPAGNADKNRPSINVFHSGNGIRNDEGNGFQRRDTIRIEIDHKNAPPGVHVALADKPDFARLTRMRQSRAMSPISSATGS